MHSPEFISRTPTVYKEQEPPSLTLKVIDNVGIKRDGKTIDIEIDIQKIKDHLLQRAAQEKPQFFAVAQKQIAGMTISLGARQVDEIEKEFHQKRSFFPDPIDPLMPKPKGLYHYHADHPYLYINSSVLKSPEEFREVWDHEVSHFINNLDPQQQRDTLPSNLSEIATVVAIDLGLSITFVLIGQKISDRKNRQKMTRRNFLGRTANNSAVVAALFIGPSIPLSQYLLHGSVYSSIEVEEYNRVYANNHKTDMEDFNQMFTIKERPQLHT